MDMNEVKYLFSEHGQVCVMCDDFDATMFTLDTHKNGYSVESMDVNSKFTLQTFDNLDDAILSLNTTVETLSVTFDFVY